MKLDAATLLKRAKDETGLGDWGDDTFEERFGLTVDHINLIELDERGRQSGAENIHWLLTDRLEFFEDRKRYPLVDEAIERLMFATGEPRSGTILMQCADERRSRRAGAALLGGHASLAA